MKRQLKRNFDIDKENQTEFLELQDRFTWGSLDEPDCSVPIRLKRKADQTSADINFESQQQEQKPPKKRRTHQVLSNITNTLSQPNPNNVSRRNERERNRVKLLNLGFDRLRAVVPCRSGEQLSKISTLKKAIWYIEHLDKVLHGPDCSGSVSVSTPTPTSSAHQTGVKLKTSLEQLAGIAGSKEDQAGTGTSWPISTISPRSATSGNRSEFNAPPSSPIFPTDWDQQALELTSTPKFNDSKQLVSVDLQSIPKSIDEICRRTSDSGYNTLETSGTPYLAFDSSSRLWTPASQTDAHTTNIPLGLSSRSGNCSATSTIPSIDWTQSVPHLKMYLRNSMFNTNS